MGTPRRFILSYIFIAAMLSQLLLPNFAHAGGPPVSWFDELDRLPQGTSLELSADLIVPQGRRGVIFKDGVIVMYTKTASINEVPRTIPEFCYIFVRNSVDQDRRIAGRPRKLNAPSVGFFGTEYMGAKGTMLRQHYVDFKFAAPAFPDLISTGCVQEDSAKLFDLREENPGAQNPTRILADRFSQHLGGYFKSHLYGELAQPPEKLVEGNTSKSVVPVNGVATGATPKGPISKVTAE